MDGDRLERVRQRAYEIWEREGRSGDPEDHWFEAERELAGAPATSTPAQTDLATRANAIGGPDPTAGAASPATPEGLLDLP